MVGALKALGIQLEERWEHQEAVVVGCGGRFPVQGTELFLGNAGTAMRCAAAAVTLHTFELGPGGATCKASHLSHCGRCPLPWRTLLIVCVRMLCLPGPLASV